MKKFIFIIFFISSTTAFADYILEPANCTLKKQKNCGAYLYNNKTGATYFCTLEKCTEIMSALEDFTVEETKGSKESKKSKIPKFKKKKKKNLKFQNLRKNLNNLV